MRKFVIKAHDMYHAAVHRINDGCDRTRDVIGWAWKVDTTYGYDGHCIKGLTDKVFDTMEDAFRAIKEYCPKATFLEERRSMWGTSWIYLDSNNVDPGPCYVEDVEGFFIIPRIL